MEAAQSAQLSSALLCSALLCHSSPPSNPKRCGFSMPGAARTAEGAKAGVKHGSSVVRGKLKPSQDLVHDSHNSAKSIATVPHKKRHERPRLRLVHQEAAVWTQPIEVEQRRQA
eukprot:scaffold7973_cov315-Pinguiococcus_pyrenoidosus.AAC.5